MRENNLLRVQSSDAEPDMFANPKPLMQCLFLNMGVAKFSAPIKITQKGDLDRPLGGLGHPQLAGDKHCSRVVHSAVDSGHPL